LVTVEGPTVVDLGHDPEVAVPYGLVRLGTEPAIVESCRDDVADIRTCTISDLGAAVRLRPHRSTSVNAVDMLREITPVPDGDYYAFLTEDLAMGIFGHPWEGSICVFGRPLVERLCPILDSVLRQLRAN
jgi:hypothetical protein